MARVAKLGARHLFRGRGPLSARCSPQIGRRAAGADRRAADSSCSRGRRSRWSARATPRPRRAASRASWRRSLAQRGLRRRLRAGARDRHRGACGMRIEGGHDRGDRGRHRHRLSARERRAAAARSRARPAARRAAARHRAARAPFPLSQPDHRRPRAGHGGGRGGAEIGIADHRAAGRRIMAAR